MKVSSQVLRSSYAECRRVARRARSHFTPCFFLLPPARRRAMEALYAFMRHTDDMVDGAKASADAAEALARWRRQTAAALTETVGLLEGPGRILPAVGDMVVRYEIPTECLYAAIDGAEMDLTRREYETLDDLAEYCYRVATVVGLACLRIWGYRGSDPGEAAHACGMAFQLTNILRDIREDWERGRVYIPQEDLQRFDCAMDDVGASAADDRFLELMRFQIDRAEGFYHQGTKLIEGLEGGSRRIFVLMMRVYYRLLKEIEVDPERVLSERVCLGRWRLRGIIARTLLQPSKAVLP